MRAEAIEENEQSRYKITDVIGISVNLFVVDVHKFELVRKLRESIQLLNLLPADNILI